MASIDTRAHCEAPTTAVGPIAVTFYVCPTVGRSEASYCPTYTTHTGCGTSTVLSETYDTTRLTDGPRYSHPDHSSGSSQ